MDMRDFERIARKAHVLTSEPVIFERNEHPFDLRNIHSALPNVVRTLFDDAHYAQSTFEACKYLDKQVARLASSDKTGYQLMMDSFNENNPRLRLNQLQSTSERDEQSGYKFIFSGSVLAIRNPRGHEYQLNDSIDECLDYLSFLSMLLRRIEKSGYILDE